MKNKVLRVAAVLLIMFMLVSLTACGKETKDQYPTPTEKFFVNDFAQVLTAADLDAIYKQGVNLQEKTTAQAVVVTVESLNGNPIEEYALEIGRKWGVGDKDKDNGVVVLLSESDREIYIAVGYGLEGALPDSKTGRIIDTYGIAYFENDNFSAGLSNIYNAIVNEIYIEYGVQPADNYIPVELLPETQSNKSSATKVIISWIILIALVALYIAVFGRHGGVYVFGSPHIFGTGYRGGGSSGGFGGFSGGGGSFGGGGAGRKF